jgi:hypothetical protein
MTLASLPSEAKETYVGELSCTEGPYRVALPKSYTEVRKLARIQGEKILKTDDWGDYKTHLRVLTFEGLELAVITFSNDPHMYVLATATITSPAWLLAGRLRVGSNADSALRGLPVDEIPSDGVVTFNGDGDSIQISISGNRVKSVIYRCYTG